MPTPVLLIPIPPTVGSACCFPSRGGWRQAHTTHQPRSHLAFPNRKADVISRTQVPWTRERRTIQNAFLEAAALTKYSNISSQTTCSNSLESHMITSPSDHFCSFHLSSAGGLVN